MVQLCTDNGTFKLMLSTYLKMIYTSNIRICESYIIIVPQVMSQLVDPATSCGMEGMDGVI